VVLDREVGAVLDWTECVIRSSLSCIVLNSTSTVKQLNVKRILQPFFQSKCIYKTLYGVDVDILTSSQIRSALTSMSTLLPLNLKLFRVTAQNTNKMG
jgi:hypothetical protein